MYKNRLKQIRERIGITGAKAGEVIIVSKSQYSNYETEYTTIPTKHLSSLCDYFNASLDYILEFTDKINYISINKNIDRKLAGTRLKEFRKDNKLTQNKLANILNTEQPVIANYENGKNIIALPFLYTICKKYNISADYLLGKTDNPKYLN